MYNFIPCFANGPKNQKNMSEAFLFWSKIGVLFGNDFFIK